MKDLTDIRLIYGKAALFLLAGATACALLLFRHPHLEVALLLGVAIWSFARLYYFAFYVIGRYVDPSFRFSGLGAFLAYLWRRGRAR